MVSASSLGGNNFSFGGAWLITPSPHLTKSLHCLRHAHYTMYAV